MLVERAGGGAGGRENPIDPNPAEPFGFKGAGSSRDHIAAFVHEYGCKAIVLHYKGREDAFWLGFGRLLSGCKSTYCCAVIS